MTAAVHILRGPARRRYTGQSEVRWCFGCRAYHVHRWVIASYDPASPHYGWHEPVQVCECSCCGNDRTRFPQ